MKFLVFSLKSWILIGTAFNSLFAYTNFNRGNCFDTFDFSQKSILKDTPKPKDSLKVMDVAIKLQNTIEKIINKSSMLYKNPKIKKQLLNQFILNLQNIHEEINSIQVFSPKIWEKQKYEIQVSDLQKKIQNLRVSTKPPTQRNKITQLQQVIENSEFILLADQPYSLQFTNSQDYTVYFNKKVVTLLQNLPKQQSKRILSIIYKGFIGSFDNRQTGLKVFRQNNSANSLYGSKLVEIKTMGKILGHIRIGGFISKNQIHFTNYVLSSDHSKGSSKKAFKGKLYKSLQNFQEYQSY